MKCQKVSNLEKNRKKQKCVTVNNFLLMMNKTDNMFEINVYDCFLLIFHISVEGFKFVVSFYLSLGGTSRVTATSFRHVAEPPVIFLMEKIQNHILLEC